MSKDLQSALAARYGLAAAEESPPLENELLTGILSRATCREFKPDPVPESLLRTLLACAQSAPSKSDLQQYAIIRVRELDLRREIASWLPAMPWVGKSPEFLVFCADLRRSRRICALHGRPHANDNLDSFLNAAMDGSLAMGSFVLAAEAAGLGCCPISYVRNHLEKITPLLGLPPGVFPLAGLCLGYPERRAPVSMRLPQSIVVHEDRYDDARLEEELTAYDQRRHDRQPILEAKQKNASVYGNAPGCVWSDQVSRQLSLEERGNFRAFLKTHGFDAG